MELLFKSFLFLHILSGSLGLITGTINVISKKGNRFHRIIGDLFVIGMLIAGISSLILAVIHPNYLLFIIGVFTIYLTLTGRRYLSLKQLNKYQKPNTFDWIITIGMSISSLIFISIGIFNLLQSNNFGIVFIVFGCISILFVIKDFFNYNGIIKIKNYWLIEHLQRMTGAYIASTTAFLVVNIEYLPNYLPSFLYWLLPTIILSPFIFRWSKKYKN